MVLAINQRYVISSICILVARMSVVCSRNILTAACDVSRIQTDKRLPMRIPLRSGPDASQHFEIAVIPISCIFMPHVDRDCSYFWSSRLYSYLHFGSTTYWCTRTGRGRRGGREREKARGGRRGTFSVLSSKLHRSAAARSRNRSTANKSRRFLRRAARVRSCPVFRKRSVMSVSRRTRRIDQQRSALT